MTRNEKMTQLTEYYRLMARYEELRAYNNNSEVCLERAIDYTAQAKTLASLTEGTPTSIALGTRICDSLADMTRQGVTRDGMTSESILYMRLCAIDTSFKAIACHITDVKQMIQYEESLLDG